MVSDKIIHKAFKIYKTSSIYKTHERIFLFFTSYQNYTLALSLQLMPGTVVGFQLILSQ